MVIDTRARVRCRSSISSLMCLKGYSHGARSSDLSASTQMIFRLIAAVELFDAFGWIAGDLAGQVDCVGTHAG
jgi:hypothetical protein